MRIPFGNCAICGGAVRRKLSADCSAHPLWVPEIGRTMEWTECLSCGHQQTDGYFDAETFAKMTAKAIPEQTPGFAIEQGRWAASRIVDSVNRRAHGGLWLDVGFGSGDLLLTAKEYGYEAAGVDARQDSVGRLEAIGVPAYGSMAIAPSGASVVSLCDVVEHVPDPVGFLREAVSHLKLHGTLFVSMPNRDAPLWDALNRSGSNPYWGEIEHYHNFGRAQIIGILSGLGFSDFEYHISTRYRCGMEITATKTGAPK